MIAQHIDIAYEKFTLENGLTVIVHEDHKAPIVAVNVWYHVGSKDERPGKTGFAHLFEHLMFGGSENLPGRYIDNLEQVGATGLNGTTSEDRTNYFENVPVSALDFALFAESDRMGHFYNHINQGDLDLQRGVVQNEKRQGDNQPYAVARELIQTATYPPQHPYAHTVIGSMEDLDKASLEDVKEWFKTYYGPSNAVLVLAGDIDVATAKAKAEQYFGDIPPGPPVVHARSWIAKRTGEQRATVQDRVPQSRVYKVWNVPGFGTAEADYLDAAASILSSGKSSRLYKRLVYDDQIATSIHAYNASREIGGQFVIAATARPGQDIREVEKAIDEELARFLAEGPTNAELERAKTEITSDYIRGLERIGGFGGKSDILATYETYVGNAGAYHDSLQRFEAATARDIKAAANAWLSDGVYVLQVLPFPAYEEASNGVIRTSPPALGPAPALKLPEVQRATLSNGLKLQLAERHEIPVVNFWLTLDAGFAADALAAPGTARLTASLLTGGTARRTSLEISDEQQLLGAEVTAGSNLDFTTVSLSALKTKLDASLDLFADVILNPSFPESDFARQQKLQLAQIEQEKAQPQHMAMRLLPAILYGEKHPYGGPASGSGTSEAVARLTREDLVKFHSQWFKPNNATLIIVGDTTLAEIRPKLEALFAAWKPGDVPEKKIAAAPKPAKPAIYLIDKADAHQSFIVGGTLAPPPIAAEEPAFDTMNNIFGGSFGGRLNMNLREEKHFTYGAGAALRNARHQRSFLAYASVQSDKTKESLEEFLLEMSGITGGKPITAEELEKSKRQQILEIPGSRETMNSVGSAIQEMLQFGFPDDYDEQYAGRVQALTEDDVNRAAKTLIDPQHTVWVIVGEREQIEPALQGLIGEIHVIDTDGKPAGMALAGH